FNKSPEVWSKLLYGTEENELSMELILNQLSTRYSFSKLIEQFGSLIRCGDDSSEQLLKIKKEFKALCQLDFTNDNPEQISNNEVFYSTWIKIASSLDSIKHILKSLINFNKQKINKIMDPYVKRLEHLINRLDIVTIRLQSSTGVPFGDGEYKEYPIPEQFKICLQDRNNLLLYQMNHLVFKNKGY
ncbi:unnamed protein product, partial [Rotaria sp. Silwood1]